MKAIEFPEVNVRIAENQSQYETLPVHIDTEDPTTPTTICVQLNPEEIKQVAETGRIWMQVLTFGQPFHPIRMSFLKPEGFTEPEKTQLINEILRTKIAELLWVFSCDATTDPAKITEEIIQLATMCVPNPSVDLADPNTRDIEITQRVLFRKNILGFDNPYPMVSVLEHLQWATKYLLNNKNYDGNNYEELNQCVSRVDELINNINDYCSIMSNIKPSFRSGENDNRIPEMIVTKKF